LFHRLFTGCLADPYRTSVTRLEVNICEILHDARADSFVVALFYGYHNTTYTQIE